MKTIGHGPKSLHAAERAEQEGTKEHLSFFIYSFSDPFSQQEKDIGAHCTGSDETLIIKEAKRATANGSEGFETGFENTVLLQLWVVKAWFLPLAPFAWNLMILSSGDLRLNFREDKRVRMSLTFLESTNLFTCACNTRCEERSSSFQFKSISVHYTLWPEFLKINK